MAPGTPAGISAGLLPVPEGVQLPASVLGGRQHVQVALLLTEPAGVLTEEDRGRQPQDHPVPPRSRLCPAGPRSWVELPQPPLSARSVQRREDISSPEKVTLPTRG